MLAAGACGVGGKRLSITKQKPAVRIAQALVVEHKFTDLAGQLRALPLAFPATNRIALTLSGGRTRGFDRVGGRAELVRCDMRHHRRMAGGKRSMPGGAA